MATNVDVKKTKKDNNMGLIRKFSRKMKQSGVLRKKRSLRYFNRETSDFKKKSEALIKIEKTGEYNKNIKNGTISPRNKK